MGAVGLWFGFGQKFQFVVVMGGNGGYRLGGGWWQLLFCLVCGFVHGCSSFKERERETGKERDGRKGKKLKKNNKEIIFKLRGKKNRITDVGCFVK